MFKAGPNSKAGLPTLLFLKEMEDIMRTYYSPIKVTPAAVCLLVCVCAYQGVCMYVYVIVWR